MQSINSQKLVAVIRAKSYEDAMRIGENCITAGIGALEITFTIPEAERVIRDLCEKYNGKDVLIGAGTVLDPETARIAILAGATFVVSPIVNADMIRLCHRYRVDSVAGAYTPNEVYAALNCGADMIKIFPGSGCSPAYIKDLHGPFPDAEFMVTGNVTPENAATWFAHGVSVVGIGSALTKLALNGETEELRRCVKQVIA